MILYKDVVFRVRHYREVKKQADKHGIESLPIHFLKENSKKLNNSNFKSELWFMDRLNSLECHSHRAVQCKRNFPVLNRYFVDFFFPELNLVVEIDGSSHNGKEEYDQIRDNRMRSIGLQVVRIMANNNDLSHFKNVFSNLLIGNKHIPSSGQFKFQAESQTKKSKKKRNRVESRNKNKTNKQVKGSRLQKLLAKNPFVVERKISKCPRIKIRRNGIDIKYP